MPLLAFVDHAARLPEVPAGAVVVALDPFVEIAAAERGVAAIPIDAGFDDLEVEAFGEETFERVGAICDTLDELAHAAGLAQEVTAWWRFQELKYLYDGLLIHGLGGLRIAREERARDALLLVREASLARAVLPAALTAAGVDVRISTAGRVVPTVTPPPPPGAADHIAAIRIRLRHSIRRQRPRVLCLDERYGMPAIVEALRTRGADVRLWVPPPRAARSVAFPDLSRVASRFRIAGVDLWPAAEERLVGFVAQELARDDADWRAARAGIRRDRPDVLLGSMYARASAKAAATAARAAGIPSVVTRHGELGTQNVPVMRFNDVDVVDWALCWGEWEARFVERYAPPRVATRVVGSPMLEESIGSAPGRTELRRQLGLGERETVFLLATNALGGDEWFAGWRAPVDTAHARHQIAVVCALLEVEGVRVVVKEHPVWEEAGPVAAWAASTGAPITFVRDMRFDRLVNLADVAVLDFPATTLVQALHGSARLCVVRHPVTIWEPGVVEHLERFGVRFVDRAALAGTLRELRDDPVGPIVYPQEAREPLAASGPGTAAERAADAVLAIAAGPGT